MRRIRKSILYILFLTVVVLIGLEIGVRIWGYAGHYIYDPIYQPYPDSAAIPFVHKPDLRQARARGGAIIDTDALGLRTVDLDPVSASGEDEFRIALLGDSVSFGEGVRQTRDTYAHVLQTVLDAQLEYTTVRVFNFSVSAYSVREMTATLQSRVAAVDPDLVVMAIIPPDFDLTRTPVVDKYGYTYNQKLSGFMAKDSFLKRMLRNVHLVYLLRDMKSRKQMQGQPARSWQFDSLPSSYEYVTDFAEIAAAYGYDAIVLLLPTMAAHDFGVVRDQLLVDGIDYLNLSGISDEFSEEEYLSSRFDRHPSAAVHERIGENLAEYLLTTYSEP